MNISCVLCKQTVREEFAAFLCSECAAKLEPASTNRHIHSLYRYNSALRSLILKVKISGNYRALACLKDLFLGSPTVIELARSCEAIVPAPSSLWSRIHGRFDLASLLAQSLAKRTKVPIRAAPFHLFWQVKKRSRISSREDVSMNTSTSDAKRSVLVLDDVVTSGHTLRRTAAALEGENCRFLTLASALR